MTNKIGSGKKASDYHNTVKASYKIEILKSYCIPEVKEFGHTPNQYQFHHEQKEKKNR
jgi:hypothetical protein